jgi:hypothetical protein
MGTKTIQNQESLLGNTAKNSDGSPKQEVIDDDSGEVTATIENDESLWGNTSKNEDGSPKKVITPKS